MRTWTSILAVTAAVALSVASAHAQQLDMDMSGMIANQMQLQDIGDAMAKQAASNYFDATQQWRAQTGYFGPLAPPVSAADLNASVRGAQEAFDRYQASSQSNSRRTLDAIDRWDHGAVRGEQIYEKPADGQQYWLPHGPSVYHEDAYGQVVPGYDPNATNLYPDP